MRRLGSRIVTVVLLAAMLPTLTGAVRLRPAAADSHPAACHHHGVPAPASQPASYQCCVAGHHSVVVRDSFSPRPPQWQVLETSAATRMRPAANAGKRFSIMIVSEYSPPGFSPLRI